MVALAAEGVRKGYGEREVLKGLDLVLERGAFEALMGPSGCGKSTFLHLAAGLLAADGGRIEVGGADVTKMGDSAAAKFRRRHVGVVFQAFNLLEDRTVRENILLPLRLDGADVSAAADRVARLEEALGIAGIDRRKASGLSGGEMQRVAIARALVAGPDIVLADEPTGNLDADATRETCSLLKALNGKESSAVLVVTHDPQVAATASRVHFLKDGRIAASCETLGDPALVSRAYLETYR